MKKSALLFFVVLVALISCEDIKDAADEMSGQDTFAIPAIYHGLEWDDISGLVYRDSAGNTYTLSRDEAKYDLKLFDIIPTGTEKGIAFDLKYDGFSGKIAYGFINRDGKYHYNVFFKRYAEIKGGKAEVSIIENLSGKYDAAGWQESGKAMLGYRIIAEGGDIVYDGKINIKGKGPFEIDKSIIHGPFLNKVTSRSANLSFITNIDLQPEVLIGQVSIKGQKGTRHEIDIEDLEPAAEYNYTIKIGGWEYTGKFKTAPAEGSLEPFTFAFASDSRGGKGGGERDIYGVNSYVLGKIAALAASREADFFQFTGDLIDGYLTNEDATRLQYYNWFRTIEPYAGQMPFFIGMGNHESVNFTFDYKDDQYLSIDKFPYESSSSEALFAELNVNFQNGPDSEDGGYYDPDPDAVNFPSYGENVYYYIWGNTAMIVLNSNYWYGPSRRGLDKIGGNLHGYIMDKQLEWLDATLDSLENNMNIHHVFITLHTPMFPNGGHSKDDMWYLGNNSYRPYINGKPVEKGIIERRDSLLNLFANKSTKVVAVLAGDEHNYNRLLIDNDTEIYPEDWDKARVKFSRPLWQITNGAAGAPYYAQEKLPWSQDVRIFSARYALCLFHIDGKSVEIETLDPHTLELIERVKLK
ncbi:MAG: metallophosphoesterase family protein [Candidatus Kapaibacterium sp.]